MRPVQNQRAKARLIDLARDPESDLAEGALWIAALEYPDIDLPHYLEWIDSVAERTRENVRKQGADSPDAGVISDMLFRQIGFRGNDSEYYDVRNSCLNHVIERRRGIPITLSVVYLAVAARLGEDAAGVAAPGHFFVRHRDVIVDPFRTTLMTTGELVGHLDSIGMGEPEAEAATLLAHPPDKLAILTRVLVNLRGLHIRERDYPKALEIVDLLTQLDPTSPGWLRDRGVIYQHLECHSEAKADLERYLDEAPRADDASAIRDALGRMVVLPRVVH